MRRCFLILSLFLLSTLAIYSGPLGTFVVVGDSLSAGFQNFSLYTGETIPSLRPGGNNQGYAELIAKQAGTDLLNPRILYPGIPPALTIDGAGQIDRAPGFGVRLNNGKQTLNLSVPSYTVADALGREANVAQVLTNPLGADIRDILELTVLGPPSYCGAVGLPSNKVTLSSVDCAVQLRPDTILVSLGNNDALQQLTFQAPPTPLDDFARSYDCVLKKLKTTNARIILATIPDVTLIPFLIPASAFNAQCGTTLSDYVVANILNPDPRYPVGDLCHNYLPVSAEQVQTASNAVKEYNDFIWKKASPPNVIIFDVNKLFATVMQTPYVIAGRTLTTAPLGGLFSLDGIHPTNSGYAIMANAAIETINKNWHLSIPLVNLTPVVARDPLVGLNSPAQR